MQVEFIEIRNYRGIGEIRLELRPQTTVLIGLNGSGKTTLLDALASALSQVHYVIARRASFRKVVKFHDIRNAANHCSLSVGVRIGESLVGWSVNARRVPKGVEVVYDDADLRRSIQTLVTNWQAVEGASIPLSVLFPTNRAVLDIPARIRGRHSFSQTEAYDHALHDNWNSFRLFFEWFRDLEDRENEAVRRGSPRWRDPQLECVRRAFERMLPGFSDLRVERNPQSLTMNKGVERMRVQQLSDGEKCILSLTADLARRLVIAHPSAIDPLAAQAIVMIDEAELHLHPSWQRKLIPRLRATFPGCQFIITTHSPQVISEVAPDDLYLLSRDGEGAFVCSQASSSYGRDTNFILQVLMDTDERNEKVKHALDEVFGSLSQGRVAEARSAHRVLQAEIGDDDPELVRLDLLIRRREKVDAANR